MIIATIGSTKFKLETLKDAEDVLSIFSRSTLIGTSFDSDYRDYAYISSGNNRCSIEITEGDTIISMEEHLEIQKARIEKSAAAKEAASA